MKKLTNLWYQTLTSNVILITMKLNFAEMAHENSFSGKLISFSGINAAAIYNVTRNASGYITQVNGTAGYMIQWLSQRYNFTHSIFQTNETALDPSGNKTGLIGYLLKGDCQILFSVTSTSSRLNRVDFSMPYVYIPVSYLILKPDSSANIAAIVGSFQTLVWVCLIISILCTCFALYSLRRYTYITYDVEHLEQEKYQPRQFISSYVLGLLFSQGGYLPFKTLPYYFIGTVWCIATFVLVNAYNSTLISHVALPNQIPIINSIYDLRDRPDVYLVTDKDINTDTLLTSAGSGYMKMLGDKLRSYSNSRCNSSKECIKLLKSGSHVYTSGVHSFLYGAMKEDYETTGQCHYSLQTESYMNLPLSLALPKGSHLMNNLNFGIIQLREAGFLDEWVKRSRPNPRQCLVKKNVYTTKSLTLQGLSGVFVVLAFGISLSLLVFIGEHIYSIYTIS